MLRHKPSVGHRRAPDLPRSAAIATIEIVVAISLATAAIAALQSTAPAAGLGIVYLLAVLTVAIRRGEVPALIASIFSVLTLNYLFIVPRHRFAPERRGDDCQQPDRPQQRRPDRGRLVSDRRPRRV